MYAVERLGSYITRGVYTVSGPFHPFGGAVDIIVVEQPDGSFKSSPWYVRFGKFQGVLKAREKIVTINVNGSDANFHMFLDPRGEAHFLREREEGEGESDVSYSSDDMDDQSQDSRIISESCSYDGTNSSSVIQFDGNNGKIVAVTNSQQSRISLRRSIKDDVYLKEDDDVGVVTMTTEISADLVETFMLDEGKLGGNLVQVSKSSRDIDESRLRNDNEDMKPEHVSNAVTCLDSQSPDTVETRPEKVDLDLASDKRDVALSGVGIPGKEHMVCRVQSSIYCETSRSLEMLHLANGESGDGHNCVETLHSTSEQLTEDTGNCQAEYLRLDENQAAHTDTCPQQTNPSICGHDRENLELPVTENSPYTRMVYSDDGAIGSSEGGSKGASSISGFSNSVDQVQDENGDKVTRNMLPLHPGSVDSVQLVGDCGPTKVPKAPVSESSEEDQFFLSDVDDFEPGENQGESTFPDPVDKERFVQMNGSHKFESLTENSKVISSPISIPKRHTDHGPDGLRMAGSLPNMWSDIDDLGAKNLSQPLSHSLESSASLQLNRTNSDMGNGNQSPLSNFNEEDTQALGASRDGVDNPAIEISLCKHLLYQGMGAEAASQAFDAEKLDINRLVSLGPEVVKNNRLVVRIRGHYFPWDAVAPVVLGIVAFGSENIFEPEGMIPVDQVEKSLVGDPTKAIDASSGSWRIWPFPFRRSRSRKAIQPALTDTRSSDIGNASTNNLDSENDKRDVKDMKKMVKATAPTSEELSSLNLKEGSNSVIFTFSTSMLGKQKVDARIYLWKWNTRIVISDVDGTITKSDVLGQFMPLVGIDWSQTGVVHLFSAIKDNGYQFLYLSARSISQAYITRQFLVNLKQDGKSLPDGPVVISPDGLFPSLYREVIRRAPHEFKISCLEDIKEIFPPDCSPFYAGFGNRDTDEISYLKVGIPKGKIFTINPKGEVAVNRLVDARSYTSLHALVHGMFPAMTSSGHVQEDYNSWNFWKLPPPHIDDI